MKTQVAKKLPPAETLPAAPVRAEEGGSPPAPSPGPAQKQLDVGLLVVFLALVGFGAVMVYSASIGVADMNHDDPGRYIRSHALHILAGLLAFGTGLIVSYNNYRRFVYWVLGASLLLLVLVLFGLGPTRNFASRWLWIGPRWAEFQPSELAKLAFVIYLAYSLEKKLQRIRSFAIGFLPHLIVCGLIIMLCLAQPDLGTCILLALVMFVMLFVAGTRTSYIVGALIVAVPAVINYIALSSRRMSRILSWLDPWQDRYDTGFQTVNSLISLGSGQWTGLGLGAGQQKMGFLTQGWTDFIFSSVGEELGFIGCAGLVLAFGYLCYRGFRIAWKAPDTFGRYLAFGITALFGIQAAFNMGVSVGLLPTKGINLPFVSGGGSSMLVCCLGMGILLNVSRWREPPEHVITRNRREKKKDPGDGGDDKPKRRKKKKKVERKPIEQDKSGVRAFVRPVGGGDA